MRREGFEPQSIASFLVPQKTALSLLRIHIIDTGHSRPFAFTMRREGFEPTDSYESGS
jgi:hypothetical protein